MPKPITSRLAPIWICRCQIDEADQQREGQDHQQHREQMTDRQRPKRRDEGARELFSISPAETASGQPIPGFTP